MKNKLVVAAAGSGKTTYLIKTALAISDEPVLITTFTEANEKQIRRGFAERVGNIPRNVKIQTWFSFLLEHGVRPYQGRCFDREISGMILVNGQSAMFVKEKDTALHFFDAQSRIYSDKIAKFTLKCNTATGGKIIERLTRIYSHILIDEVQDFACYDLDLLKLLFASPISTLLVGDPRQGTYSTHNAAKNKKFKRAQITQFFDEFPATVEKDDTSLLTNFRCSEKICNLSNLLFPEHPPAASGNSEVSGHDGIFLVRSFDVDAYLRAFAPMQLRDRCDRPVNEDFPVMNFGVSKGLSFDRVLIYPTGPILTWLRKSASTLAPTSRAKLYVAITRARLSVAFVYDFKHGETIGGIPGFLVESQISSKVLAAGCRKEGA